MSKFKEIAEHMIALQEKKNSDYGNSFYMTCDKFGLVSALTRLNDKLNRVEQIYSSECANVESESMADTLIDLAAYSLMTIDWLSTLKNSVPEKGTY